MSDKDLTGKDLAKNLSSSKKDAAAVAKSAKEIESSLSRAARAISGAFGKGGFMAGGGTGIGIGGGGGIGGGMPKQADMNSNSLQRPGIGLTDFTNFAGGMAKGLGNFLPDVSSTIQRAGNYYNATIMGGYRGSQKISRGEVDDRTYGVLASMGGITSAGSSSNVANIFANQGMVATSGTYMQNVRGVGNAARYLNMSNEKAANAIGGLGMGASSANMMRNFGVYTTDPTTGKERSMSEIFEDLAGRFTKPGANASSEDVQNSIRKGALGAAISASGLSDDQQSLFKQYMIDRAGGNKMDLSSQSAMNNLMGKAGKMGNSNPLNAMMDLETSGEGAQKSATGAYTQGIETAAIALKGLDAVAGALASKVGAFTAGLQLTLGSKTGSGLLDMVGASLNLISSGMEAAESADPTGLSRVFAGNAAISTGTAGLLVPASLAITGAGAGALGVTGASDAKGGGDDEKPNPLANLSDAGFTIGGTEKTVVGQPIEGALKVSGYKFGDPVTVGEQKGKPHSGIDYAATTDTRVYAVADGTLRNVVRGIETTDTWGKTGNGNYVCIDHGMGKNKLNLFSYYKHLSKVNPALKQGKPIKKGTWLGNAGETGDADGVHLHYQVVEGNINVDPKLLSAKLGNKAGTKVKMEMSDNTTSMFNAAMGMLQNGDINTLASAVLGSSSSTTGFSLNSTSPANAYANAGDTGTGGTSGSGGNVTNNVGGITVNIKDASPESAKKFAEIVQEYLNSQTLTSNLGSL